MSDFVIARTTIEDVPGFRRVQAAGWNDTYPNEAAGVSAALVREYTDSWLTPEALEQSKAFIQPKIDDPEHYFLYVAKIDGTVVGMSHGYKDDVLQDFEALYVHTDYRKLGIGHALITQVLSHMDPTRDVEVSVVAYNGRAIQFYEKHGFRIVPGSQGLFQTRHPELVLPDITMIRKGANA